MSSLDQALESMRRTLEKTGWAESTSPMPQPGLTSAAGRLPTTTASHTPTASQAGKVPQTRSGRAALERTPREEELLLVAISKACALQKQYGKTAAELETLLDGYLWILDDIPTTDILMGMKQYISENNDIPTPADIRAVLFPKQPALCPELYKNYQRRVREGQYLLKDERDYCRAFEQQEHSKLKGPTT